MSFFDFGGTFAKNERESVINFPELQNHYQRRLIESLQKAHEDRLRESIFFTANWALGEQTPEMGQTPATIEQVHEEVLAEAENALRLVKSFLKEVEEEEVGEVRALEAMGFGDSTTVKRKALVAQHREIAEWLSLFPTLKYIPRKKMEEVAEKYSLVIDSPENFTGPIPKENRAELAEFYTEHGNKPEMIVVGTIDQFATTGRVKRGPYLVEDPDPIVLWKLNEDDWFIVTMWGPEAEIEELQR